MSKCENCEGKGRLCRRCGDSCWPYQIIEFERMGCTSDAPHEAIDCPECGGKGRLEPPTHSDAQVKLIRGLAGRMSQHLIGAKFGVKQSCISRIITGVRRP